MATSKPESGVASILGNTLSNTSLVPCFFNSPTLLIPMFTFTILGHSADMDIL